MKINLANLVVLVKCLSARFEPWVIGHVRYDFKVQRVSKNDNPVMIAKGVLAWLAT